MIVSVKSQAQSKAVFGAKGNLKAVDIIENDSHKCYYYHPESREHIMPNIPQNLKQAGLKTTLPRIKILEILKNNEVRHVSAEDVYKLLLESGDEIGLATVYRVLTDFENSELVIRHNFEGGRSVFELNDQPEHDHMVCTECGHVFEFRDEKMNERQKNLATNAGFSIADHSLYVYGTCDGIRDKGECDMPPKRDLDIIVKN